MDFRGQGSLSQQQLESLLDVCAQASRAICEHYYGDDSRNLLLKKEDQTPLTLADIASHEIISSGLKALTPDIPILSEESSPEEIAARRDWPRCWMVDPLDGTKEFLGGTGEFTINIALIEAKRPTLGIIYQPLKHLAYVGIEGQGAFEYRRGEGTWESAPVSVRPRPSDRLVLLASRRHRNDSLDRCIRFLEETFALDRQNSGSALKFCDLASGSGDLYPRFSPCSEWDVAAGDALVHAAGGAVLGLDGQLIQYNNRDTLLSPHFIAVGDGGDPLWADLLAAV